MRMGYVLGVLRNAHDLEGIAKAPLVRGLSR
jgi:hypothetical protein